MKEQIKLPSRQVQVVAIKSLFDDIIDRHAEAYLAAYPEVKEFSNFDKSGTSNYYIGMVWTSDFEKPQIGSTNQVRLRGSESLAKNKLVELDLNFVHVQCVDGKFQESLFPGQIVAFKAEPFLSTRLVVIKFLDPIRIAPAMKSIHTHEKIVLAAACGPFMKPDQEDWSLYDNVIESVRENKVTHLILTGPFVDMANKFSKSHYEIHWKEVIDKLIEGLHDHECQIYLVPSNRDILHSSLSASYFYPCPGLKHRTSLKEGISTKCHINFITDPAQIEVDGIFIDVTSADVAFHMSRCISFINRVENMLTTIFRHMLVHGIYPMYPSHPDIAVDYPNLKKFIHLDRLGAHILILPNQLGATSVHTVERRLVLAIKRCSVGKQLVVLEIPGISGAGENPTNSLEEFHTSKIIDLKHPASQDSTSDRTLGSEEVAAVSSTPSQDLPIEVVDAR